MADQPDLESLYREAQSALKGRDYVRASELLRQILQIDENYKDTARLLAQMVRRRQGRWYDNPRIWIGLGALMFVVLAVLMIPRLGAFFANPNPTTTATALSSQTSAPKPTPTPTLITTPVPLAWNRISIGQEFQRDRITVIVIDPKDADIVYIGTDNAGIYKSIDGGASWKPVHTGLGRASIYTLVIDPLDPSNLYAGVVQGGVYKTTDGGEQWTVANAGFLELDCRICIVVINPSQPTQLLYTDGRRIYATSNSAEEWTLIKDENTCPDEVSALAWHPRNSALVFATNYHNPWGICALSGVYRSEDGGQTWIPPDFEMIRPHDKSLLISQQTGNNLYVQSQVGYIYLSRDGGVSWGEEQGCGTIVLDPQNESNIYCASGEELQKYEVIPEKPEQVWWRVASLPVRGDYFAPLVISPHSSQTMFFGERGIWFSSDGGLTWNERSNGLGAGRFELRVDPAQSSTLYADNSISLHYYGDCQPFFSTDAGRTWEKATEWGCGMSMSLDGKTRYWLEKAQDSATLHISTDAGETWTQTSFQQPIHSVIAHPTLPGKVYVICQTDVPSCIYVSSDYGQTWHKSAGINKLVGGRMFFSASAGERIYVVSGDWQIYASDDAGENWQESTTGATHARSDATRLVIDPSDSNHLFLATLGRGILVSADGGQSWRESNAGLGSLFVNTLAIDPNNPDLIYAGTDGGAHVSFDGGENWGRINDGLLGALVVYSSIVIDPTGNVYAATPYGIFKLESR